MYEREDHDTQDSTCCINHHIPESGAPPRDKGLNGLVNTGHQKSAGQSNRERFGKHTKEPGKQCAQAGKFREMSRFADEVVQLLRSMSPVWRDLQTGKREYIL